MQEHAGHDAQITGVASGGAPELSHYIAGGWIAPTADEWTEDRDPSDMRRVLAQVPVGSSQAVDDAVASATAAFPGWRRSTGAARAEALHGIATVLGEQAERLAQTVASEVGKPIGEARAEVARGVAILRYFAEEAVHPNGLVIPSQAQRSIQFTLRQPLGPVGVISPWNFPVAIPLWKIAPAIAFGNTVVWKPAELAALTASRILECVAQAQLPPGVVNLVLGKGSIVGERLVGHPDIRAITFTGSDTVGTGIAIQAAKRNIKYQMEMGGKNAALVLADANLRQAASLVAAGAMRFAGQKCTATSRVIVEDRVLDQFLEYLVEAIDQLPVAPARDPVSAVGPVITADARDSVADYVRLGAETGSVVVGGAPPSSEELAHGNFILPTVLVGVAAESPVAQDEVFGPLLVVLPARSLDDAIALANSTRYGLSVSLFTRNIDAVLDYVDAITSGMVRVNADTTGVDPHAPFGGMRSSSSHSREQGPAAVEFFTELKTIQMNAAGDE